MPCPVPSSPAGNDKFSSLGEFDKADPSEWPSIAPADDSMYMNHSCDATGAWVDAAWAQCGCEFVVMDFFVELMRV